MPTVEVELRQMGRVIPNAVTPAAVQKVACRAGVELKPVSCGAGEAAWTFTAEDTEDLRDLLQDGLVVAGTRLTMALLQRRVTVVASCAAGSPVWNFTAAELKELLEDMSGKSLHLLPDTNTGPFTFEVNNQSDADAIVELGVVPFKVRGVKHRISLKAIESEVVPGPPPTQQPAAAWPEAAPVHVQPPVIPVQSPAMVWPEAAPVHVQPPEIFVQRAEAGPAAVQPPVIPMQPPAAASGEAAPVHVQPTVIPVQPPVISWAEAEPPPANGLSTALIQKARTTAMIIILHDAENCPLPRGIFAPDADGRPRLVSHTSSPEQHINAFTLRDKLLREVLTCVEGPAAAGAPGRLQELKYEWNFVLQYSPQNPWHPHQDVMEDLYQIAKVTPCGTKPGAVDVKIKGLFKKVEMIYRDAAQEEKDRTLVVLISGDRDFVEDVRDLRQPFMQKSGLRVVVVHSADNPPTQALLDAVGDRRLALGIWQRLVEASRGPRPHAISGSSSRSPALCGSAARRASSRGVPPQRAAYSPGPPMTDLIETYSLKTTFASFLNQQPQVLAPVKEEISQLHPALVLELQLDWKARSHAMRLRIMTGGRLAQPSSPQCEEAARLVQTFLDSLREATLSELRGIRDDERSDDAVAAPLPGVSGEELRQNSQLAAICHQYNVLVFIPNLGRAGPRMRKLRENELFIVAGNAADVSNDEIMGLCWERYKVVCKVDRSSAPPVVAIDTILHPGAALFQAKQALSSSGFFSENPKVDDSQQHTMIFYFPSDWTPQQMAAFRHRHGLDFVEAREPPRVKPQWTTIKIFCSSGTRALLLHMSSAPDAMVKCTDWQAAGIGAAAAASIGTCSVILVYQRGNEQGRDAVWNWLLSLTNRTDELSWPESLFIEKQLMKRNWRAISASIRDLSVRLYWNLKDLRSPVKVSGPADAVDIALGKLQDIFNSIAVEELGTVDKKGCPNLEAALRRLLEDLTTRGAQRAGSDTQSEETSDEEDAVHAESGSSTQGPSQSLRSIQAWQIHKFNKTCSLAYFEGDQDLVQSIKEDLEEFLASYVEQGWQPPHPCDQAALSASYRQDWKLAFAQKMGLTSLDWVQSVQEGRFLWLCGPLTNVQEAAGFLGELFTIGQPTELTVSIDFVTNALLKMKFHKERRAQIIQTAWDKFKPESVRILQPADRSLKCVGQGGKTPDSPGPVHRARDFLEQLVRQFADEQAKEKLELTAAELDFLQGEGKELLRDMHNRGCFYRFEQKSKSRLAHAQLVTGCNLEVWNADAVMDFPDVQALVNSANEKLQHGGGIAADIARAAGPGLDGECKELVAGRGGSLKVAEVVTTSAYDLDERGYSLILHAVAPRYPADGSEMEATVSNILAAASARRVQSLVLPLLGAGIFGWPLERAVGHIFAALGKWAQAEAARSEGARSSLKRIVLVDLLEDRAKAAADRLQQLVEEEAPSTPQAPVEGPPAEPEEFLPKIPTHAWYWNNSAFPFDGTVRGDGKWIAYDYDQVMQLEKGMETGQQVVELNGDILGKASDSACILQGRKYATYEVHLDESGPGHVAVQYNQAVNPNYGFKFPRAVRREELQDREEAFEKVGLLQERYEMAQEKNKGRRETYLEELKAYHQRQAEAQSLSKSMGGFFAKLISFFFFGPAAAEAPAPAAKVFLPVGSRLLLVGPPEEVSQVRKQLRESMQIAYTESSKPLALGQDMKMQGVRDSILQHLADCNLSEVQLEIQEGTVKLRALGEKFLLRAERAIAEWQALQAWRSCQVQYPPEWTESSKQNADKPGAFFIEVEPGTEEYAVVEQRMRDVVGPDGVRQKNAFTKPFLKVERVENPMAFRAYDSRCKVLKATARNNGSANELWVKHGTGTTDPIIICEGEEGLDYRYSAWGMFGKAAYMAEDANYSNRSYHHELTLPDGTTQRQMILCRVAAGCIKEETHATGVTDKLIKPPPGYDSVRGDVVQGTGDFAIMVYSIDQAYPAYLITYEP